MSVSDKNLEFQEVLKWKSDGIRHKETHDWYSSDSEKNFKTHTKKVSKKTYDFFKIKPFKYKFNNEGYRTPDDFKKGDTGIVYLGCSHTAGVGTPYKSTWVNRVHDSEDGKCFNLGIPAASPGTCFRILSYWKEFLNIDKIFHYSLLAPRYEFIYDIKNPRKIWDYHGAYLDRLKKDKKEFPYDNFIMNSFLTEEYRLLDQLKNFMAINDICNSLDINYYLVTEPMLEKWTIDNIDIIDHNINENNLTFVGARDARHYGTKTHFVLSEYFKKLSSENKSTKISFDILGL